MGLANRRFVGWALSDYLTTNVVADALRYAIEARPPAVSHLFRHSDRECEYTDGARRSLLRTMTIDCSVSCNGSCCDAAAAKRFFRSLAHERTDHAVLADWNAAKQRAFEHVAMSYNSDRVLHALTSWSPHHVEADRAPAVGV